MISKTYFSGLIYNLDKTIASRKNGLNNSGKEWNSIMIWVKIKDGENRETGQDIFKNKVFTLWNDDVIYADLLRDNDPVSLECHQSSRQDKNGNWNEFWIVDKFEIIGKSKTDSKANFENEIKNIQTLAREEELKKLKKEELEKEELEKDGILWD